MRYESHIDLRLAGPIARRTERYRRRKAQALGHIRRAFAQCADPAYISISGGKDSLAMLALVAEAARQAGRSVVAWAHVSDASFPGTVEVCREACRRADVDLLLDASPVSAWEIVGAGSRQQFGKRGVFFDAIAAQLARGYGLAFVGVRAAESKRRRDACRAQGAVFRSGVPTPHWKCHPLADCAIEDVAGLLDEYDMPIHPIYDKLPVGSLPIRLGYATALDLLDRGTVVFLRRNYPEIYRRLIVAYPPAADYR